MLHPLSRIGCIAVMLLAMAAAGCAGKSGPIVIMPTASGNRLIVMDAGNYKFKPRYFQAAKPGSFILQVRNTSWGTEHNLTLKDPHGKVVKSVDIHPGQTVISNIELTENGTYLFYCSKRFHAWLGMKGKIVIGPVDK